MGRKVLSVHIAQTSRGSHITGDLVKKAILMQRSGKGPGLHIPNTPPGDTDCAGPWTTLRGSKVRPTKFKSQL